MGLFDGIFNEVGGQFGGAVQGVGRILTGGQSGGSLLGGLNGKKRGGRYGAKKTDPRGFPMLARDGRLATRAFGGDLPFLNYIPSHKFLFFVRFVRPAGIGRNGIRDVGVKNFSADTMNTRVDWSQGLGFALKKVDRPSINFEVQTMNQYNKKRQIQTKVEYSPVTFTFYDTYDLRIQNMFHEYFAYYYGDARKVNGSWDYDVTNREFRDNPWGFMLNNITNPQECNFFSHIEVYQFWASQYIRFDLINPKIVSYDPDQLSYEEGSLTQEVTMKLQYEGITFHNEGKFSPIDTGLMDISGLSASDFYESEDGPVGINSFQGSWIGKPKVTQPSILDGVIQSVTETLLRGGKVTGSTISNSVLNSFGKFAFGAGGMSGGNNISDSVLRAGTGGVVSGQSGRQILGGVLTGGGYGPVGDAVSSGNYRGLALAGAVGALGGLFSGSDSTAQTGSRIQWNSDRFDPSTGGINPYANSNPTMRGLAAENNRGMDWQQTANAYNSGYSAELTQATYATTDAANAYHNAKDFYGPNHPTTQAAKARYEDAARHERDIMDRNR